MSYKTVGKTVETEFIEKKSVFIGLASRVFSEEEAKEFIASVKIKYKDARHHVYAYTLGEEMNIQRYSDDGEPQGTGGIPILEVIKKNELRNVCVVVIRYFGGILLGAGGLTRAYVKGASEAISGAGIVERVSGWQLDLIIEYDQLGKIQHHFKEKNIEIITVEYTDKVKVTIYLESDLTEKISSEIKNLTSGDVTISKGQEELFYKDGNRLLKVI
ncbi:YigZ family protein [Proteiniclasticum sp.]|uniref:YigZ family protein n=1 Tax=Proteiniclasticum sp. TaxID=2053595 RepID=UPI002899B08E|nr:YigZ family protein [Proteiniclasticum sp.]